MVRLPPGPHNIKKVINMVEIKLNEKAIKLLLAEKYGIGIEDVFIMTEMQEIRVIMVELPKEIPVIVPMHMRELKEGDE